MSLADGIIKGTLDIENLSSGKKHVFRIGGKEIVPTSIKSRKPRVLEVATRFGPAKSDPAGIGQPWNTGQSSPGPLARPGGVEFELEERDSSGRVIERVFGTAQGAQKGNRYGTDDCKKWPSLPYEIPVEISVTSLDPQPVRHSVE